MLFLANYSHLSPAKSTQVWAKHIWHIFFKKNAKMGEKHKKTEKWHNESKCGACLHNSRSIAQLDKLQLHYATTDNAISVQKKKWYRPKSGVCNFRMPLDPGRRAIYCAITLKKSKKWNVKINKNMQIFPKNLSCKNANSEKMYII